MAQERFKYTDQIIDIEIPKPNKRKIQALADTLPASVKRQGPEFKIEAVTNAYYNVYRTKNLIKEGMVVYPGVFYAKKERLYNKMLLRGVYQEIKSGIEVISELEKAIQSFRDVNKIIGQKLAADIRMRMFGKQGDVKDDSSLDHLALDNRAEIETILGIDTTASYQDQFCLKPNISISEYFYTKLFPFGTVINEKTTYVQQVFPENEEESTRTKEVLKAAAISRLPDRPTDAASTIIYKKLTAARRRR